MSNKVWIYLFFLDFFLELLATANNWNGLGLFTKPLLMPALAVWFLFSSKDHSVSRYYIVFALLFSWIGDILLMMEDKGPLYFIAGLVSFLAAHIIYIFFFLRARKSMPDKKPWNFFLMASVGLYAAAFFSLLYPYLGNLKLPVLVYALTISVMLICALHTVTLNNKITAYWWLSGAILFILSDSLLAFNKYYSHFPVAGLAIMLTYGLAQFAIVNGTLKYLAAVKDSPVSVQPYK
jgi:uncharacterized membrane protein YhhN